VSAQPAQRHFPAKNELLTPDVRGPRGGLPTKQAAKVYARYQELLLASNA
jgi:hypothetical protein